MCGGGGGGGVGGWGQLCQSVRLYFDNGTTLKGKICSPVGANSFLLEKTPFQKYAGRKTGSHKSSLPCKKKAENLPSVSSQLKGF